MKKGTSVAISILLIVAIFVAWYIYGDDIIDTINPEYKDYGVSLKITDDGGHFLIGLDDIVNVTLGENPSTGYSWNVTEYDTDVLELINESYYIPNYDSEMVGQPGNHVWLFKAMMIGVTTLKIEYARAWEDAPIDTFEVTFKVVESVNTENLHIEATVTDDDPDDLYWVEMIPSTSDDYRAIIGSPTTCNVYQAKVSPEFGYMKDFMLITKFDLEGEIPQVDCTECGNIWSGEVDIKYNPDNGDIYVGYLPEEHGGLKMTLVKITNPTYTGELDIHHWTYIGPVPLVQG